jgi:hypothetical protein
MITIKVVHKDSGKPAKGYKVSVGFDGFFRGVTDSKYTDDQGEVHFDNDPGDGEVYVSGNTVYKGRIVGRTVVYI